MSQQKQELPKYKVRRLMTEGIKKFYMVWGDCREATMTTVWVTEESYWSADDYLRNVTWRNQEIGGREFWYRDGGACLFNGSAYGIFTNYWLAYGEWVRRGKKRAKQI